MAFRDEMPSVAYIHCPRCGSETVEVQLRWTVQVKQMYDGGLSFETAITTSSASCECPNYVPKAAAS